MVGLLIGLRLTIQAHTLPWRRYLGLGLGAVAAVATWAGFLAAEPGARHDVATLLLTMWLVGWVLGPILTSGASVLRPEYFTLLPLDRRRLGVGLLATVFVGVGVAVTVLGVLSLVAYGLAAGSWAGAFVGLVAAALFVVGVVALSRAVYALLGAAMRTTLGVEIAAIQYGAFIAAMFVGWALIGPVVSAVPVFLANGLGGTAATVLDATPAGWAVSAVDAAVAGAPLEAAGRLVLLALFAGLAVLAAVRLLTPSVDGRPSRRRRLRRRVVGRPVLPATPLGGVVGKELRTWQRDPWRSLEARTAIWFGIFAAVTLALVGVGDWAALAGVGVAVMVAMSGANLYGQDGTALWQLVVAQSPTAIRADVRGRQLGIAIAVGAPAVLLSLAITVLTGAWGLALPVLAAIVVVVGVGSGVSALMSVLAVTPGVDPAKRANANDAGENSLAIQTSLWVALLLSAPTLALMILHLVGEGPDGAWVPLALVGVAVVNGVGGGWLLGSVAIRALTTRLPETFARLRYPALRVAGDAGGGVLGAFARQAEKSAQEARRAAEGERPGAGVGGGPKAV